MYVCLTDCMDASTSTTSGRDASNPPYSNLYLDASLAITDAIITAYNNPRTPQSLNLLRPVETLPPQPTVLLAHTPLPLLQTVNIPPSLPVVTLYRRQSHYLYSGPCGSSGPHTRLHNRL